MSKDKLKLTFTEKLIINNIVAKGLFTRQAIAEDLNIALSTVGTYMSSIYKKTNTHNIAEIIWNNMGVL